MNDTDAIGRLDRKSVLINSQFREQGTASSFRWRFQERVENIRHAEIRFFVFENGVYNVDQTNNTFYLSEDGTLDLSGNWVYNYDLMPVSIPEGYYDDQTLASTISLAMSQVSYANNSTPNIYFTQILSDGKLAISIDDDINFAISFGNGTLAFPGTGELLGFGTNTVPNYWNLGDSDFYRTIVSPNPMRLASFDYLLVQSQKLGNDISFYSSSEPDPDPSQTLRANATSCFAFIPNTTPSQNNSTIIWENYRSPQIYTLKYPYSLDYVDITIVDKYGRPIKARDNNVSIMVELYTDKDSQNVPSVRR